MASGKGGSCRNSKIQEAANEEGPIDVRLISRDGMFILGNADAICEDKGSQGFKTENDQVFIFEDLGEIFDLLPNFCFLALLDEYHGI